jgi:hypothetical protein
VQLRTIAIDTLVTMMLTWASKDRVGVTIFCGTMLNVHATYPRMGGGSSHSKLCGSRTVGVVC